jgi:hypothetical protein
VQDDTDAFKQQLMSDVVAGECVLFTNGDTVHVEDTAIFSGSVQVRRHGETTAYWTNLEAVK